MIPKLKRCYKNTVDWKTALLSPSGSIVMKAQWLINTRAFFIQ